MEFFENFDLLQSSDDLDGAVGRDVSESHAGFVGLLQDSCHTSDGIQLHRATSGSHQGVMRTISLTRYDPHHLFLICTKINQYYCGVGIENYELIHN